MDVSFHGFAECAFFDFPAVGIQKSACVFYFFT